jgi:hypothetical protein
MKIKSTKTTIEYEGRILVAPGGYFDGDAISDSLSTSAQSINLVGSPYKHLEQYKNASVSRSISTVADFSDVESALKYKLGAEDHAALSMVGNLTIDVGDTQRTYKAALTQLDSSISLSPNSVRVVLRYDFITGKLASEDSQL